MEPLKQMNTQKSCRLIGGSGFKKSPCLGMENLWQAQERPWFQARVGLHKMLEAFSKIPVETKNVKMRVEKIPVPFGNQTCCNWEINYGGFDGKSSVNEWIFQHAM